MEAFDLYPKLQHRQDIWLLNVIFKDDYIYQAKNARYVPFFFDCDEHGPLTMSFFGTIIEMKSR